MTKHPPRYCRVAGCHRVVKSQKLCQRHGAKTKKCKVEHCKSQAQGNHCGMCKLHYNSVHPKLTVKPPIKVTPPNVIESNDTDGSVNQERHKNGDVGDSKAHPSNHSCMFGMECDCTKSAQPTLLSLFEDMQFCVPVTTLSSSPSLTPLPYNYNSASSLQLPRRYEAGTFMSFDRLQHNYDVNDTSNFARLSNDHNYEVNSHFPLSLHEDVALGYVSSDGSNSDDDDDVLLSDLDYEYLDVLLHLDDIIM